MKIPFTLDAWLEDKSQKVETREGRPVKIISFDMTDTNDCPIAAQFRLCAGTPVVYLFDKEGHYKGEGDSDYDLFIITSDPELSEFEERIFKLLCQYKECDVPLTPENIKSEASMLWADFEKYFFDLYGKEGEGDSALRSFYYKGLADGKAEALKDLPRWRKADGRCLVSQSIMYDERGFYNAYITKPGCRYITWESLRRLPGFNE